MVNKFLPRKLSGLGATSFINEVANATASGISTTDDAGNQYYTNGAIFAPSTNQWFFPDQGIWYNASDGSPVGGVAAGSVTAAATPATSTSWISGIPNGYLLIGGGVLALLLLTMR
jgi:hypothetical protein